MNRQPRIAPAPRIGDTLHVRQAQLQADITTTLAEIADWETEAQHAYALGDTRQTAHAQSQRELRRRHLAFVARQEARTTSLIAWAFR